jgi:RNA polymerase sigma-70 factor (ECF subfamily)
MSRVTPEQLGSLLARHAAALRLFAAQYLRGTADDAADDVVQEALVQLARRRDLPDDPAAWLFRVVRNGALTTRRSAERRRRHEQSAVAGRAEWFEPSVEARLDAAAAATALAELPDDVRETVVAHLWGGLTFEQIAEVVGTSSSTAHRRYEQGLAVLRQRLEEPCRNVNRSIPD